LSKTGGFGDKVAGKCQRMNTFLRITIKQQSRGGRSDRAMCGGIAVA
jgi:hypothetical protein